MLTLSPKELKAIAKIRGIKGYKSLSDNELLSALTNFPKAKIEKIRK